MLGLKDYLEAHQLVKLGLRFTRRVEVGTSSFPLVPAYQLDRGRLENALALGNVELGVVFWDDCEVRHVSIGGSGVISFSMCGG